MNHCLLSNYVRDHIFVYNNACYTLIQLQVHYTCLESIFIFTFMLLSLCLHFFKTIKELEGYNATALADKPPY